MSDIETLSAKLDEALARIGSLEAERETAAGGWTYLVQRPHAWRRQLSIKGRNLTVGQLISTMRANSLSPSHSADAFDLPIEAILEAMRYADEHRALIELERIEELSRLRRKGHSIEPAPLSR